MSMTRKMLMSIAKVTCTSRSVRSLSVRRLTVPFASIVIVIETSPAISSACPW